MKFTEKLATLLTPEWRKQYINYVELKQKLTDMKDSAPPEGIRASAFRISYAKFEEDFFQYCDEELVKVNTFFANKMAEAQLKYVALSREISQSNKKLQPTASSTRITTAPIRKKGILKFAFSEFYLSLVLLQNYQTLNHTGFRKILKKHDKILQNESGMNWFWKNVANAPFHKDTEIMTLIHNVEDDFTSFLEGGDRAAAMKRLRVPPLEEIHHPWCIFRTGYHLGVLTALLAAVIAMYAANIWDEPSNNLIACVYLFRAPFLNILFLFFMAANKYGWNIGGVNHILIFEIDPRDHMTATQFFELAAIFGVLWALCVLGYLYWHLLHIPPFAFPLILIFAMVAFMVNPLHIWHYTGRIWLLKLIGRVVTAPFHHVGFADFWMGDQLNSLVHVMIDYRYIVCFYVTNRDWYHAHNPEKCRQRHYLTWVVVHCLPAWFRFAQCLRRYRDTRQAHPFLTNAGKYASTFPVVAFSTLMAYHADRYKDTFRNPYAWGYLICHTCQTIYCLGWDYIRDFGVFQEFQGKNMFLREQLVYPQGFYYFAIVENFILRFMWALTFYLREQDYVSSYNMSTISGLMEVVRFVWSKSKRRYIWNYFRLENEHLNNAGEFRAVRDISVGVMNPSDPKTIASMMDELDGVQNRGTSKKKPSSIEEDNQ